MKHPPSQAEVELELSKQFEDGDFTEMGKELDRDRSTISKIYSPNDLAHKSPFYKALRHLYYMRKVRPELAMGIYKVFDLFARKILFNGEKGSKGLQDDAFRQSIFNLIGAELDRLPNAMKLRAVQAARFELEKYENGLMHSDMDESEAVEVSGTAS